MTLKKFLEITYLNSVLEVCWWVGAMIVGIFFWIWSKIEDAAFYFLPGGDE
jgi:tellurite resistance protein TehA-like permease